MKSLIWRESSGGAGEVRDLCQTTQVRNLDGKDNVLTLNELYSWLDSIEPEPRAGNFGSDEPGSDFVFVVKH